MGKGDVKTKRGKIWRGSHGKARPKLVKIETELKHQHETPAKPAGR